VAGETGFAPPALREILVPIDPWVCADAAAQAARLGVRLGSRLTLYHALEFPDHEEPHWAFGERSSVWKEEERLAREFLAETAEGLGVAHRAIVERTASPVHALLQRIKATAPDLIVMASNCRGFLAHALVGSVTEEVVERSRSPVLSLRGDGPLDRQLSGRIVLTTDLSEGDRPALRLAGLLALTFGGELLVLHAPVAAPGWTARGSSEPWRPYAAVERWLEPMPAGVTVRVAMTATPSLKSTFRIASDENAGLVVVPRRTSGESTGSPAGRVVQHARCSVLVV
jgi:nucleotide-binding universal stress UspA family protein